MKIDIHVHTKKIKTGDTETRNVTPEKFNEIIRLTDVRILAITNHNHFDLTQYLEISEQVKDVCQIWPGIELDIIENGKRAHLLVIANPKIANEFSQKCEAILKDQNVNTFNISIADTVKSFGDLDCVYIAHYMNKTPNLGDEEIKLLSTLISNPKRIIKEAANSISAGIFISHGHNSIYGSDIHNWDEYEEISKELPDLRLPVDSFEQFCFLLEKDEATIDTVLSRKVKENITVTPFGIAEAIRLDIYNDINILFGSKGTGKTDILKSLSDYFNSIGHKTSVYMSNNKHLDDAFDLKGANFNIDVSEFGIEECEEEIEFIKNVTEVGITSLGKYKQHFSEEETNRIAQKLKIKTINFIDEENPKRRVSEIEKVITNFKKFALYVSTNNDVQHLIDGSLIEELITLLERILSQLIDKIDDKLLDAQSIRLLNQIVSVFNTEIAKKTGVPQKPTSTGFAEYARNRIKIERAVDKIISSINTTIQPIEDYSGNLGEKGNLFCRTNLKIQNGSFVNGAFTTIKNINKTPQKEFGLKISSISNHIYSNELFEKIAELNQIEDIEHVRSVSDLLLFNRHFVLNGNVYSPSNGESSMILLHKELTEDKEIYLIDEPEKSLGNDYINDVIVPIIKEKALLGKKVIIATHDANIAVRTLPYNSIYRLHENGLYYTLTGNPFFNKLKCINGTKEDLDWKEISMKTLEGGRAAFGERGKIYGN
jgi:predicted ATPase